MLPTGDHLQRLFLYCPKTLALLAKYSSPTFETSIAKGIPVIDENLRLIKDSSWLVPVRIKYRGSRRPGVRGQATCLKKDAKSFAIYLR